MNKNLIYKNRNKKVLIIGLGQLGLPVAKYIRENTSFDVYGYDISQIKKMVVVSITITLEAITLTFMEEAKEFLFILYLT